MSPNDLIPRLLAVAGALGLLLTGVLAVRQVTGEPEPLPPPPRLAVAPTDPAPIDARPAAPVLPPEDACGTAGPSTGEQVALAQERAREEALAERRRELAREALHDGAAALGCARLIVWEGGSARGRIDPSGLVHRDEQVAGKVGADGHVIARDILLGEVDPQGAVSFDGRPIGRIDGQGDLWRDGQWIGRLRSDGSIVWRGQVWGRVEGYTGSEADRRALVAYLLLFSGTFR